MADTHYKKEGSPVELIRGYDCVIHAGDYVSERVVFELESQAVFYGVAGNSDSLFIQNKLGRRKVIELDGFRIGIFHGHGQGMDPFENAKKVFSGEAVDVVVFGHSHTPILKREKKTIFVNPGSATLPRSKEGRTAAEMLIKNGKIKIKHIRL